MDDRGDDREAEVDQDAEFEREEFPVLEENDQETEVSSDEDTSEIERDIDPDASEI